MPRAFHLWVCVLVTIAGGSGAAATPVTSRAVLDNGLTVLAVQNMSTQVAGAALVIKASAADEAEGKRGTRSLLQQLILSSTRAQLEERPGLASAQVLASRGISVSTDYELVEGVIASTAEELGPMLKLAAQSFFAPTLDEESLEKARELVQASYDKAHQTPLQATYELFREAYYGSGPLRLPLQGEPDTIDAVTLADLKALHDEQYVASNAVLCVVAPLSPAEIISAVKAAFGTLPKKSAPPTKPLPPLPESPAVEVGSSEDLGQASIVVGVPLPSFASDDSPAGELITELLRGSGGRIDRDLALLQTLGLAIPSRILAEHYPINVLPVPVTREPFLAVHALCAPSAIERVHKGLLRHLLALRTQSVSDEEMLRARTRVMNSHALENARPTTAALRLCRYEAFSSAENSLHIAERVAAVTKQDLTNFALKYFTRHAVGVQMPYGGGGRRDARGAKRQTT